MQRLFRAACVAVADRAGSASRDGAADDRQHQRSDHGRPGSRGSGRDRHGQERPDRFLRTDVSDGEGIYRLLPLPVGTYDITAELQGFTKVENKGIVAERRADARRAR